VWFGKLTVVTGKVNTLHKAVSGEQIPRGLEYMPCDRGIQSYLSAVEHIVDNLM